LLQIIAHTFTILFFNEFFVDIQRTSGRGWKSTVVTEQRNDSYRPIAVEVDYSFIVIDSRSFLSWAKGVIENAVAS
jgi:hypothetical protein